MPRTRRPPREHTPHTPRSSSSASDGTEERHSRLLVGAPRAVLLREHKQWLDAFKLGESIRLDREIVEHTSDQYYHKKNRPTGSRGTGSHTPKKDVKPTNTNQNNSTLGRPILSPSTTSTSTSTSTTDENGTNIHININIHVNTPVMEEPVKDGVHKEEMAKAAEFERQLHRTRRRLMTAFLDKNDDRPRTLIPLSPALEEMAKELIARTNKLDGKTPMFVSRPTRANIKNMHKAHQVRLWCKRNLIMLNPPAVVPHPSTTETDKPVVHLKKRVNARGIEQDEDETWSSEAEDSEEEEEEEGSDEENKKKDRYTIQRDADGKIEVVKEKREVAYHRQGDLDMYTPANLKKRNKNKFDPDMLRAIHKWWRTMRTVGDKPPLVDKDQFIQLLLLIYNVLIPGATERKDETMKIIETDFGFDSHGSNAIGMMRFHDALYQLADNWTVTTDIREYVAFLHNLYELLTVPVNKNGTVSSEDEENKQWQFDLERELERADGTKSKEQIINEFLAKRGSTSVDGIERLSQLVRPPTPPDPNPRTKKPFDAYGGAKQRPIPIQQHGPYDGKQKLALRENLTGPGFHHALDGVKAVSSYIGETIPRVASPPPLIHPALWRIPTSSEPFLPYSERAKLIWMARSQPEQFDAMTEVLGQQHLTASVFLSYLAGNGDDGHLTPAQRHIDMMERMTRSHVVASLFGAVDAREAEREEMRKQSGTGDGQGAEDEDIHQQRDEDMHMDMDMDMDGRGYRQHAPKQQGENGDTDRDMGGNANGNENADADGEGDALRQRQRRNGRRKSSNSNGQPQNDADSSLYDGDDENDNNTSSTSTSPSPSTRTRRTSITHVGGHDNLSMIVDAHLVVQRAAQKEQQWDEQRQQQELEKTIKRDDNANAAIASAAAVAASQEARTRRLSVTITNTQDGQIQAQSYREWQKKPDTTSTDTGSTKDPSSSTTSNAILISSPSSISTSTPTPSPPSIAQPSQDPSVMVLSDTSYHTQHHRMGHWSGTGRTFIRPSTTVYRNIMYKPVKQRHMHVTHTSIQHPQRPHTALDFRHQRTPILPQVTRPTSTHPHQHQRTKSQIHPPTHTHTRPSTSHALSSSLTIGRIMEWEKAHPIDRYLPKPSSSRDLSPMTHESAVIGVNREQTMSLAQEWAIRS